MATLIGCSRGIVVGTAPSGRCGCNTQVSGVTARAYTTATQPFASSGAGPPSTWTAVSFSGVRWDTSKFWSSASPTRLTIPSPGYYNVGGAVRSNLTGSLVQIGAIRVNGSAFISQRGGAWGSAVTACSNPEGDWYLNGGDYVELLVASSVSGSLAGIAAESGELWVSSLDLTISALSARVRQTTGHITAAGAALPFDAKDYDTGSFWSAASPTRLTVATPGYYRVWVSVSGGTSSDSIALRVNGSTVIARSPSNTGFSLAHYTPPPASNYVVYAVSTWRFAAHDYIEAISADGYGSPGSSDAVMSIWMAGA